MKLGIGIIIGVITMFTTSSFNLINAFGWQSDKTENNINMETNIENMKLGAFSVSLSVKDLSASKTFYENLGFTVMGGDMEKNYLIMNNNGTLIGLFHGMFENNILTFNPGWDQGAQNVDPFQDVRSIQKELKSKGIAFTTEADEDSEGPASFIITDPDGNTIYVDQHR